MCICLYILFIHIQINITPHCRRCGRAGSRARPGRMRVSIAHDLVGSAGAFGPIGEELADTGVTESHVSEGMSVASSHERCSLRLSVQSCFDFNKNMHL